MRATAVVGLLITSVSTANEDYIEIDLDQLDAFAIAHLNSIQQRSFDDNLEYCGLFAYDEHGGIVATGPNKGQRDSCDPKLKPDDLIAVATYHTHGAYTVEADTEVPSIDDLEGDISDQLFGYISTPGGRVWFNDWENEFASVLCGPGCVLSDPDFKPCRAFLPDDEYTVDLLEERESSDPGYC